MTKKTPFYDKHLAFGAKMVEFAGYSMPVYYSGINAEHLHVREAVGVFDVSHMGEFFVEGPDALDFLQKMTVNDVKSLVDGQAQYSAMCYEDGGIVDDCIVYRFSAERFMLVVNAANLDKDRDWMLQHKSGDLVFTDRSEDYALLAVQGPRSRACLQELTDFPLETLKFYHFTETVVAGERVILSRTGYTGELGYEIYHLNSQAELIWDAVFTSGEAYDIRPIGLGARDTLRLEMKYCLYGNDIDQSTHPLEAGLGWITKLKTDDDFIGKTAILEARDKGLKRKLAAFIMEERGIPRHGCEVVADAEVIGHVTSGTQSPSLGRPIGLAYVASEHAAVGSRIGIRIRGRDLQAEIVKAPFVNASPV